MGLTSSQGRLLMLTSRMSDIQLDEILISHRQNQLAWQSEKAAKEYQEKTTNMKMVMKVNDSTDSSGYKVDDLTYNNMTSMGYLITDSQGRLYLTKENGEWKIPSASNLPEGMQDMFDGGVYKDEQDGREKIKLKNGTVLEIADGKELLADKKKLQSSIINGILHVLNTTGNDTLASPVDNLEANTSIEMVYDTSDDAEAESKYNYASAMIARQDNMLDMEMKQLETQNSAVAKELDAVKDLIKDNVERTFNLFKG